MLLPLTLGAMGAAAVTAVALAIRRREHLPAAVALVILATCGALAGPFVAALPQDRIEPWTGLSRMLVYLDGGRVLAEAAIVPGLALVVVTPIERRRRVAALVVAIWALASVVLAALYPAPLVRGESLARVYLAADLVGLVVAIGALVTWGARTKRSPGSAHVIAVGLVLLDLGILLVPHSPWRDATWTSPAGRVDIVRIGIVVFFSAFAAAQGVLWAVSS